MILDVPVMVTYSERTYTCTLLIRSVLLVRIVPPPPYIYIERVRVRVQLCACTRAIVCAYMRVYMRVYILCVHARARVYENTRVKAGEAGRI